MCTRSPLSRRDFAGLMLTSVVAVRAGSAASSEGSRIAHGLAMHGEPALPEGFAHFPYANPFAPKGGRIALGLQGSFDSLNTFIVRGVAPDVVPRFVVQGLMTRSLAEPFTLYGLIARSVEIPSDRSYVAFRIDPRARFSDGRAVTAEDVRFSFELLKRHGRPFYQTNFSQIRQAPIVGDETIRFELASVEDRELPLLLALMPVFPAHATDEARFAETSFQPLTGSGPYRVSEVRPGERIVLTRRPDYWATDLAVHRGLFNFDEIRYDFYRDANTLFEAFKVGLYDLRVEGDPGRWRTGYDIPAVREGRILRETIPIALPKGMNGYVFNTRRPLFADIRVREALGFLFDFEWVNRNLYYGTLRRTASYFDGSDLSARGVAATGRERALLAPFPGAVRPDILEGRWLPPASDGSGRDRDLARQALSLLGEAGWLLDGDVLRHRQTAQSFAFEILVNSRSQERLALNFAQSLSRVGVQADIRLVDDAQYWRRLSSFDFDMVQWTWPVSASPGAEQRGRFGSDAADRPGTLNYAGAKSPAIDRMIEAMLAAESREDFVAAVRALDRVLLSGFYVVPLFHIPDQWLAYDAKLKPPPATPLLGRPIELWWRERP
jgi:peptide/nickel transport system substrate-binding protein